MDRLVLEEISESRGWIYQQTKINIGGKEMEYINDITINEAVVHVLDNNSDEPILNEYTLDLNEEIYKFIYKHIERCLKDEELRYAIFNKEKNLIRDISQQYLNGEGHFLDVSKELAKQMFLLMRSKGSIASCDLVIVSVSTEYGPLLVILKMDYIKNYIHNINFEENKIGINITPQYTGLPASGQKIQKCAFIKPLRESSSFDLMVIDKQNKSNEEYGARYFTDNYLGCTLIDNERDMTKKLLQATERWTNINLRENADAQENIRSLIKKKLKEEEELVVEDIAEELFGEEEAIRETFVNYIRDETGNEKVTVDKEWVEKKLKRVKLRIDKDIEIYINEEAYNDNSKFEIRRNGDGTINMILKNISNYVEK